MATPATQPRVPDEVKGHPYFGNLLQFAADPLGYILRTGRAQGDLIKLRTNRAPYYVLNHPDLVEQVMVTEVRNFPKGNDTVLEQLLGTGLLLSRGDFWLRQRRLMQPAFHRERIAGYGQSFVRFSEQRLEHWRDGQMVDIHHEMMALTLLIVAKTLFGTEVDSDVHKVGTAMEQVMERFNQSWQMFLPQWVPTPARRKYPKAIAALEEVIYQMIDERSQGGRGGDGDDLLSMLMQARDEDGSAMTTKQLRDEAMTLFLAGHETTAGTLSFTWHMLSQHPEAEAKLHAELADVLGGRTPTMEDLPRLKYTEAVVQETLRLYPPAFMLSVRLAREEVNLGGYHLPKWSQIMVWPWLQQRDPRFWDQPDRFMPERWEDGLAKRLPRFAYYPFGGGPRLCIGSAFAMMEAVMILATIAQRYRLVAPAGRKLDLQPAITLRPKNGLPMTLRRR